MMNNVMFLVEDEPCSVRTFLQISGVIGHHW